MCLTNKRQATLIFYTFYGITKNQYAQTLNSVQCVVQEPTRQLYRPCYTRTYCPKKNIVTIGQEKNDYIVHFTAIIEREEQSDYVQTMLCMDGWQISLCINGGMFSALLAFISSDMVLAD